MGDPIERRGSTLLVVTENFAVLKEGQNGKSTESTSYNLAPKLLQFLHGLLWRVNVSSRLGLLGGMLMIEGRMSRRKFAVVGGVLVVASAAGLAAHLWVAVTMLLGGTGVASLAAYVLHRHRTTRHAGRAASLRLVQPCPLYLGEKPVPLYAQIESLRQTTNRWPDSFQSFPSDRSLRRDFSEHPSLRKVPVRRPDTARGRRHLMEWGHR